MIDKNYYNYFMLPQSIEGIGYIYPVKLEEYNEFKELAVKYIVVGRKWLTNILKYPKDEYILDFFVKNAFLFESLKFEEQDIDADTIKALEENNAFRHDLSEMIKILEITLKEKVEFELLGITDEGVMDYRFKIGDSENYITKFNFEEYRTIVMEQNLLFEPLTSPSEKGNEVIQNAIRVLSKNGVEQDIISVCSSVSVFKGVSDKELCNYTYYRLMCDFETVNRLNNNLIQAMFMSQGSEDAKLTYLGEKFNVDTNPYSNLMKRAKDNQLDRRLQS